MDKCAEVCEWDADCRLKLSTKRMGRGAVTVFGRTSQRSRSHPPLSGLFEI